jgi:hypothetical protein
LNAVHAPRNTCEWDGRHLRRLKWQRCTFPASLSVSRSLPEFRRGWRHPALSSAEEKRLPAVPPLLDLASSVKINMPARICIALHRRLVHPAGDAAARWPFLRQSELGLESVCV